MRGSSLRQLPLHQRAAADSVVAADERGQPESSTERQLAGDPTHAVAGAVAVRIEYPSTSMPNCPAKNASRSSSHRLRWSKLRPVKGSSPQRKQRRTQRLTQCTTATSVGWNNSARARRAMAKPSRREAERRCAADETAVALRGRPRLSVHPYRTMSKGADENNQSWKNRGFHQNVAVPGSRPM